MKEAVQIQEAERWQATADEYRAVLDFWFGATDAAGYGQARKAWFEKNAGFDAEIRARFAALHARAEAGQLAAWEGDAASLLALIVVLDQFPRNMYRDTPRAFASDARALAAARLMVAHGWDRPLMPVARTFVYLPYEHSENLADQDEAVRLFEDNLEGADMADNLEWARKHREVIARFGRFPHRNAILGRPSTLDEEAFLGQPGSRF